MKDRGDDPQALGTIYGDLINMAIADIPPDMTVTMHLCRGNYKSTFMAARLRRDARGAVRNILSEDEQWAKLKMIGDTAREVWG